MGKAYVAEHSGHAAIVYELDGKWMVNPVVTSAGDTQEVMKGDKLIDGTAKYEKPFDSLDDAKRAAQLQLQEITDNRFELEWKEVS